MAAADAQRREGEMNAALAQAESVRAEAARAGDSPFSAAAAA